MSSKILTVQARIVQLLQADPQLSGIDVIADLPGDIQTAVEAALQRTGVGIIVIRSGMGVRENGKALSLKAAFAVMVTENVLLNRSSTGTNKTAEEIAERVLKLLYLAHNGSGAQNNVRTQGFTFAATALEPVIDDGLLIYRINVETEVPL